MAKNIKVEKPAPKKPEKSVPKKPTPKKKLNPNETALKNGVPQVMILNPRISESSNNPVFSVDKNTKREHGRRYKHEDYNKKAVKTADAETETEPVRARHVQLDTPVRWGPTIIDPNGYIREQFASFELVPKLTAELELERIQRIAVLGEYKGMREQMRGLELGVSGARRERDDAIEAEMLALKDRDEAVKEKEEAVEMMDLWKKRANKRNGEKKILTKKFEELQKKTVGKMTRAIGRLAGATTDKEIKMATDKLAEMISAETEDDSQTDWSSDGDLAR